MTKILTAMSGFGNSLQLVFNSYLFDAYHFGKKKEKKIETFIMLPTCFVGFLEFGFDSSILMPDGPIQGLRARERASGITDGKLAGEAREKLIEDLPSTGEGRTLLSWEVEGRRDSQSPSQIDWHKGVNLHQKVLTNTLHELDSYYSSKINRRLNSSNSALIGPHIKPHTGLSSKTEISELEKKYKVRNDRNARDNEVDTWTRGQLIWYRTKMNEKYWCWKVWKPERLCHDCDDMMRSTKLPEGFCCYSNLSPKVIQPSFDAQSLHRLHSDCAKTSTHANRQLSKFFSWLVGREIRFDMRPKGERRTQFLHSVLLEEQALNFLIILTHKHVEHELSMVMIPLCWTSETLACRYLSPLNTVFISIRFGYHSLDMWTFHYEHSSLEGFLKKEYDYEYTFQPVSLFCFIHLEQIQRYDLFKWNLVQIRSASFKHSLKLPNHFLDGFFFNSFLKACFSQSRVSTPSHIAGPKLGLMSVLLTVNSNLFPDPWWSTRMNVVIEMIDC
ncbi:hypothetical protein VP01_1988g1 [Puccinia sorghi]|uniref:Uncharacterized protein n=1 Tax=Puccinia sorghi TaxID=27349 RepID=A0A0L6VDG1_9BASI|nr:hypothetical protein VP01_1988g1 [Puccinia sorghi]